MNENADWLQNPLLKTRLSHVTNRDITQKMKKYYPHTMRKSKRGADVIATYLWVAYNCLGENDKPRYTIEELKLHTEIKSNYDWQRYKKRHFDKCESSMIYKEKFLLLVHDLKKLEEKRIKTIHEKINLLSESK